jgi:hypothetical protein
MSFTAGSSKHLCQRCSDRKARFRYRGMVRADRDHTLCFQCFRSERERLRSRLLAEIPPAAPLKSSISDPPTLGTQSPRRPSSLDTQQPGHPLKPAQIAHRLRMLEHLERCAR